MSDAHTVVTRAWAGPSGVTWSLGTRNVPQEESLPAPYRVWGRAAGGTCARGWRVGYRGITKLSFFFFSHLPNPPPTSV